MKGILSKLIPLIVLSGLIILLVLNSRQFQWQQLLDHPALMLVFCLGYTFNTLGQYFVWFRLVNRNQRLLSHKTGYRLFSASLIAKYLPAGKFLQLFSFAHFGNDAQIKMESMIAWLISVFCGIVPGSLIVVFFAHDVFPWIQIWLVVLSILVLLATTIFLSSPFGLRILFRLARKKFPAIPQEAEIRLVIVLESIGVYSLVWIFEGLALLALLRMVNSAYDFSIFGYLITVLAVTSFAGYFAIIAPAGLGVREGLFVLLLCQKVSLFESTFLSVGSRIGSTIADFFFVLPMVIDIARNRRKEKSTRSDAL